MCIAIHLGTNFIVASYLYEHWGYNCMCVYTGTTFSDGASPCQAVIKRHQTLVNAHTDILSNISAASVEVTIVAS